MFTDVFSLFELFLAMMCLFACLMILWGSGFIKVQIGDRYY
ncbi:hypothetical protein SAMN03159341_10217 [Paenibacillus sp. 1_12]|nr:hypothetical protein SAMN03159341_10217 [Paenibacillus sp. 1_12]